MTIDDTELKPCPVPWCQGTPSQFTGGGYWHVPQPMKGVRCTNCGATAPDPETWNTRHTPTDGLAGELAELIEKATDDDLCDGGRYFHETFEDLTRCYHGDTGEYQGRGDGHLVEWLWNNRRTILTALQSRTYADGVEDAAKVAEGWRDCLACNRERTIERDRKRRETLKDKSND